MEAIRSIESDSVFQDPEFPLRVMRVGRQSDASLHGHRFHELVLILGGSGRHVTAAGEYPLSAGDVFLIHGATAHGYLSAQGLRLINILFSPRPLRLPLADLDIGGIPGYHALFRIEPSMRLEGRSGTRLGLSPQQLEHALTIVDALSDELTSRQAGFRFMSCSHLMRLIGFLSRCYSETKTGPVMGISRALSHIEQHYGERITVQDLAALAGMSESTFMRRFNESIGRSPIDYLIHTRIARACDLLRHADERKLTDIAMVCGFEDGNYFSRQFRRVKGLTPREYREAMRHGAST